MVEMEVRKVTKGVESNMVAFDFERTPITQIADYIIITASNNGTSDIHFDPRDDGMMVRFRIDGDLQDYTYIPKIYERNLSTRLKLLANMNITESRLPQDGAIKGEFGGKYLDMRVSCLPLNTGEKIVIRILDYTRSLQGVDNLGFNQTNLKKIRRMMGVPNGIILVTGATGSGKSTTVYSILQELNKPEINIITVEDPIEMNIEGMNQVQVNSEIGMTFAAALRSILRQDPNIILIGEIRDSETAQIAVRASITGHLVLSTIHTNNALSTIERLLDMDVERYLLSTSLTGIVAQRLAKKLCMSCRVERETTKYEKKVFKKFMNRDIEKIYDANPKGCDNCRKGYKGRIAIHEVLELDDEIRNALANSKITKEELSNMVYGSKTITMLQDALGKAISGLTSFEEVYRVIEMESDPDDDTAYLTRAIEDIPENENKENQTVDSLNGEIKVTTPGITNAVPANNIASQKNIQDPTKVNINNLEGKNINTTSQEATVTAKVTPTMPQVITLTPEQQKVQAEIAKQKLAEKNVKENEKKITDLLSKPQEIEKQRLVITNPDLKPTVVQQLPPNQKTKTQSTAAQQQLPPNQYQLPKSSSEQIPQPKIEPPKMEKMEKAIPELNISIKTSDKKAVIPTIDESPLIEKETTFDEKDKVEKIDINKISKSTDLQQKKEIIDNPLKPTITSLENSKKSNESNDPIIIGTFDVDDELKKSPKLSEIRKSKIDTNIKDDKKMEIAANLTPTPKVIKPTAEPTTTSTSNTLKDKKDMTGNITQPSKKIETKTVSQTANNTTNKSEPIIKSTETKIEAKTPIVKIVSDKPQTIQKPVEIKSEPKIETKDSAKISPPIINIVKDEAQPITNSTTIKSEAKTSAAKPTTINENKKSPTVSAATKIIEAKTVNPVKEESHAKPLPNTTIKAKITEKKNPIVEIVPSAKEKIETPAKIKSENKSATDTKIKTNIPTISSTNSNNKEDVKAEKEKLPTTFELPAVTQTKNEEPIITSKKEEKIAINTPNIFELPAITQDKKIDLKDTTKPVTKGSFITEMKPETVTPPINTTPINTKSKNEETKEIKKDEKKPFITEMKPETVTSPINTKSKDEEPKEIKKDEKKPFITEMKPETVTSSINVKSKDEEPKEITKDDKKPFITEMKTEKVTYPPSASTSTQNKNQKESITPESKNNTFEFVQNKRQENKEEKVTPKVEKKPSITEEKVQIAPMPTVKIEEKKASYPEQPEKEPLPNTKANLAKETSKPTINIFAEPDNTTKITNKKTVSENTEILDLDIDGELLSLGED